LLFMEEEIMKLKNVIIYGTLASLLVISAGCSLPGHTAATPFVFPTPNQTMTALFNSTIAIPPTATPPSVQTATSQPVPSAAPAATATAQGITATASLSAATKTPTEAASATSVAKSLTATSNPTVISTPSGPVQSTTGLFSATPPNLNGDWSEWKATEYPVKFVAFVNSAHPGSSVLQASYRVSWDADNLYLAVKVKDATYVQNATGKNIYKGDSVELLLDANLAVDAGVTYLSKDDYQIGISPGNPSVGTNPEAYLWYPSSKTGARTDVKVGTSTSNGYYRVEAAIPWSVFGITPANGMHFGFAVSVSDDDSLGTTRQERMISSVPNRDFTDPTTWGVLTLTK
jgi:hypothetical protein